MKKLTIALSIMVLCAMVTSTMAEEGATPKRTYTHVPLSISFIPNLSIGGLIGGNVITNCSINIIAGYYARLRGVEFGSVLNWETEEVLGAQFSGVVNLLENGDLKGLQAGVLNYVGGNTFGSQLGVANYIYEDLFGIQSGVVNYSGAAVMGAQLGVVNYTGESFSGIQVGTANYINYAGNISDRAAQIAVVNVAGELTGAQIGVVNIARKMKGTQIGVLNYADELDGAPVGIFSFVRKGQIHVDLWASETSIANMALKTGSKHFYSILATGFHPSDPYRFSYGVGIGGHIPHGSRFVNVEALSFQVYEDIAEADRWNDKIHLISKLRLIGGWEINPRFSAFAGLTLNVFVSEVNDGEHIAIASFYEYNDADKRWVRMWPGFVAGIQF